MKVYAHLPKKLEEKGKVFTYECALTSLPMSERRHPERLAKGKRYRVVKVLHPNLRGRTDLHGRLYEPSEFLFTEK